MTEQAYIRSFFGNYWKIGAIFLVVGLVAGYLVASQLKPTFDGSVTFTVSRKPDITQSQANYYVYDGFYNAQSALFLRDNFIAWMNTPNVMAAILAESTTPPPVKTLATPLSADGATGTMVTTTYRMGSEEDAQKLGSTLKQYAPVQFQAEESSAEIKASDPVVTENQPPRLTITLATGLGLVIASFFVTLLMHYLKNDNT